MASTTISTFLEEHPSIKHHDPTSPTFPSAQKAWLSLPTSPSLILRPQSATDVEAIVSHCVATSTPFNVRSGGHDSDGRSQVPDILQIDMRDIAHVHVSTDRKTARVGGGILSSDVLGGLEKEGLMAVAGSVGGIGYVGWSTLGGYGAMAPRFGLGFDQIVGARVVNAEGNEVEACGEMLEGLRGGGGNFGVVTELTIKVYPSKEVSIMPCHPAATAELLSQDDR